MTANTHQTNCHTTDFRTDLPPPPLGMEVTRGMGAAPALGTQIPRLIPQVSEFSGDSKSILGLGATGRVIQFQLRGSFTLGFPQFIKGGHKPFFLAVQITSKGNFPLIPHPNTIMF